MKKRNKKFCAAAILLLAFVVWTILVRLCDVAAIGPRGSSVGFSALNGWVHRLFSVHMTLYTITDWLGLVPIAVAFGFAVLGLVQWIVRGKILRVDHSILVLGGFYLLVIGAYVLFEMITINYRPVLINGYLETSYPSSTTMLVACVMPTAWMQMNARIKSPVWRRCLGATIIGFTVFMVVGRLISGVHWFTDIVGGLLLSGGFVMLYAAIVDCVE